MTLWAVLVLLLCCAAATPARATLPYHVAYPSIYSHTHLLREAVADCASAQPQRPAETCADVAVIQSIVPDAQANSSEEHARRMAALSQCWGGDEAPLCLTLRRAMAGAFTFVLERRCAEPVAAADHRMCEDVVAGARGMARHGFVGFDILVAHDRRRCSRSNAGACAAAAVRAATATATNDIAPFSQILVEACQQGQPSFAFAEFRTAACLLAASALAHGDGIAADTHAAHELFERYCNGAREALNGDRLFLQNCFLGEVDDLPDVAELAPDRSCLGLMPRASWEPGQPHCPMLFVVAGDGRLRILVGAQIVAALERPCRRGNADACLELEFARRLASDQREPITGAEFEASCATGSMRACYRLARALVPQEFDRSPLPGIGADPDRGIRIHLRACAGGFAGSCSSLAGLGRPLMNRPACLQPGQSGQCVARRRAPTDRQIDALRLRACNLAMERYGYDATSYCLWAPREGRHGRRGPHVNEASTGRISSTNSINSSSLN